MSATQDSSERLPPTSGGVPRITRLVAIHARIPLKRRIQHASFTRTENDTILVRCDLESGIVGYGEGLPRVYVTGETLEDALTILKQTSLASLLSQQWHSPVEAVQAISSLSMNVNGVTQPEAVRGRDCFGHAARCAVELALLDASFQYFRWPLWRLSECIRGMESLTNIQQRAQYSTVITTSSLLKALFIAAAFRYYKFSAAKVKLSANATRDRRLLWALKLVVGKTMDLRVDANEVWRPGELDQRLIMLKSLAISAVEQPLPHRDVQALAGASGRWGIPIVLDESLCSLSDAQRAINEHLCDLFNLRISKCGGMIACLQLARLAAQAGLGYQLGCQVGETGILTAAGRHLACSLKGLRYLEGSYDRLLVAERLTTEDLTFKRAGWGKRIDAPGLGIQIDPSALQRVTIDEYVLYTA